MSGEANKHTLSIRTWLDPIGALWVVLPPDGGLGPGQWTHMWSCAYWRIGGGASQRPNARRHVSRSIHPARYCGVRALLELPRKP